MTIATGFAMKAQRASALAAVVLLSGVCGVSCKQRDDSVSAARTSSGGLGTAPEAPGRGGECWLERRIPLLFNPTLHPALEPAPDRNGEQDRLDAMFAAVDAWNAALIGIGAMQQIDLMPVADEVAPFASIPRRNKDVCVDSVDPNRQVTEFDWEFGALFTASATGPFPGDAPPAGPEAGWTYHPLQESDAIDALGVTTTNGSPIKQAGITQLTHMMPRGKSGVCERIPWVYPNLPVVPRMGYDYYSVMLHEIGHALGLGHEEAACTAAGEGMDVMRPFLMMGQRLGIGPCEIRALMARYGAGGSCAVGRG